MCLIWKVQSLNLHRDDAAVVVAVLAPNEKLGKAGALVVGLVKLNAGLLSVNERNV